MGTFNADCALVVSEFAKNENKLFMVTGSHLPELTGAACNSHTFVFMPNASMLAQAVVPQLVKTYGTRWYMITTSSMDGKAMAQAMVSAGLQHGVEFVGETLMPFGSTDFSSALATAMDKHPTLMVFNLGGPLVLVVVQAVQVSRTLYLGGTTGPVKNMTPAQLEALGHGYTYALLWVAAIAILVGVAALFIGYSARDIARARETREAVEEGEL